MYNWYIFTALVLLMLIIDLSMPVNKNRTALSYQIKWSVVWVFIALIFNIYIWYIHGFAKATEFFIGYLVEKSLSLDNIFVFLVIFQSFNISIQHQKKVLFWGVIGAVLLRGIFVWFGIILIETFSWSFYVFGLLLIYNAIHFLVHQEKKPDWSNSKIIQLLYKTIPVTKDNNGSFFVSENGKLKATQLFIVLVMVELSDIVFAIDSIPAIFAITKDPYIVFTSNIFAVLGLRSLFFVLSNLVIKFRYLRQGLSIILIFIGIKMLLHKLVVFPWLLSLFVIASSLLLSITYSIKKENCSK